MANADQNRADSRSIYYALAILHYLDNDSSTCLIEDVIDDFTLNRNEVDETVLLKNKALLDDALRLKANVIELDSDPYGPPIISAKVSAGGAQSRFEGDAAAATSRYLKAGARSRSWLVSALKNFAVGGDTEIPQSAAAVGEQIDSTDSPDAWAPLPLDRQDPELNNVIQKIDELVEDVRSDNDYAATCHEEKKFVLDKLHAVSKVLKEEAAISWMHMREFAIKPIAILSKRFGRAVIGIAAEAAKAAIKEWLKKRGLTFLDGL